MLKLSHPLARAGGLAFGYVCTFWSIRLIYLTLVTYSFMRESEKAVLQKIGDVVGANQVLTYGISALVFVTALQILQPLTHTRFKQIFDFKKLKVYFATNALNGAILAAVLIAGTTLGGHMTYLGIYLKFDEVVLSLGSAVLFGLSLFSMVLVEEYILRAVVEPRVAVSFSVVGTTIASSACYLGIKLVQFDLGWVEAGNLILINLVLSVIARKEKSFMASAAFAGSFFVIVHVLFGLPFMGQDMPGFFLLRAANETGLGSLLSGGAGGPESGLVLSVLLATYLYLPQIRFKKSEV